MLSCGVKQVVDEQQPEQAEPERLDVQLIRRALMRASLASLQGLFQADLELLDRDKFADIRIKVYDFIRTISNEERAKGDEGAVREVPMSMIAYVLIYLKALIEVASERDKEAAAPPPPPKRSPATDNTMYR